MTANESRNGHKLILVFKNSQSLNMKIVKRSPSDNIRHPWKICFTN